MKPRKSRRDSNGEKDKEKSKLKRRSGRILHTNLDESYDEAKEKQKALDKFQKKNFINIYLGAKNDLRVHNNLQKLHIFNGKLCSTYVLQGFVSTGKSRNVSSENRVDIVKLKQERKSVIITSDKEEEYRKKLVLGGTISRKASLYEPGLLRKASLVLPERKISFYEPARNDYQKRNTLNFFKRQRSEDQYSNRISYNDTFGNNNANNSYYKQDDIKQSIDEYKRSTTIDSLKSLGLRTPTKSCSSTPKRKYIKSYLKKNDFYFDK
jgi:hypothetical protein